MRLRMEDRGCPTEWGDDDGTASHVYVDMYYLEGEKGVQTLRDGYSSIQQGGSVVKRKSGLHILLVVM